MDLSSIFRSLLFSCAASLALCAAPAAAGAASTTLTVTVTILPTKQQVAKAAHMVLDVNGVQRVLTEQERVQALQDPQAMRELVRDANGTAVLRIDY